MRTITVVIMKTAVLFAMATHRQTGDFKYRGLLNISTFKRQDTVSSLFKRVLLRAVTRTLLKLEYQKRQEWLCDPINLRPQ